jgi:site-specific recombinase XerD
MDTRTHVDWIAAFAAYLTRRFPDRATTKHYVNDMQIFVRAQPKPLPDVTRADIDAFIDAEHARGCAPATVKRRAASLTTFFAFLAEELDEPTRINPVCMRRHAGRQPQHLPRDLTDLEVRAVLAVIDVVRDLAMVCLMLYAGLRVGEVVTLLRRDVTVPDDPTAPIRLRVMGKGRKERVVYLVRAAFQPVQTYLQTDPPPLPTDPLFRSRMGTAMTVAGIQARVTHYAQCSGVPVTCHRLRHTFGRWMAEGEVPVLTLSRLLGHASIQTTQRYIDGADPQVQHQYEAAIQQLASEHVAPAASPAPTPAPPLAAPPPVTVIRPPAPPVDGQRWLPDAPADIREGVLTWLQHQWGIWKPSQRQHHAQKRLGELRGFWQWQLAHRPLTTWVELSTADIAAYMDAELARGIAPKTVKTTLDRVYEVLRYLVGRGAVPHLPVRPALTLPDPLPRHLSPAEVIAIETTLQAQGAIRPDASTLLDQALYYLLCHAGLRISEALDLEVQDVDLAGRRIRVREGKGRRDRVVYLSAPATQALTDYLPSIPHAPGDLVMSRQSRPLRYEEAWTRIRAIGIAAGVAGVSPHRLRHTYATQLLNHGMSLEGLRSLMGHENLETTLIYARLADTTLEQQYRGAMERVTNRVNVKLM